MKKDRRRIIIKLLSYFSERADIIQPWIYYIYILPRAVVGKVFYKCFVCGDPLLLCFDHTSKDESLSTYSTLGIKYQVYELNRSVHLCYKGFNLIACSFSKHLPTEEEEY